MKLNMSALDRTIRILIAAVIGALYFAGVISGTLAIILGIIAVIFVITGFIGWCPIYSLLKVSTKKKQEEKTE